MHLGKVVENVGLLLVIMAALLWCALCTFGALRLYQALGLEANTMLGRALAVAAAGGGLAFAIWSMHRVWRKTGRL